MKIYTKTGDKGKTSIVGGTRVDKCSQRIETYGTIDELNSFVGLLRTFCSDEHDISMLLDVQKKLFMVGGNLATDKNKCKVRPGNYILDSDAAEIESEIDSIMQELPPAKMFIIPGGTKGACYAHVCRTICRRAEREIYKLESTGELIDEQILKFINRLSDYFFVLARKLNKENNTEEEIWTRQ